MSELTGIMADQREPALSIREFCIIENIAAATYYKMRRRGYGPDETRVPGTALVRITRQARREWHARMAELQRSREAELEAARRQAQTAAAGRRAAQSPLHVSNRRKAMQQRKSRGEH
jgi:hypothetical protein